MTWRLEGVEAVLLVEIERERSRRRCARPWSAPPSRSAAWVAGVDVAVSPRAAERLWAMRHAASPILAGLPE